MSFDKNDDTTIIYVNGKVIEKVHQFVYLGHLIGPNSSSKCLERSCYKFNSEVNLLMAQFGKVFSSTRHQLFQAYCMSFYGSSLWDYSGNEVDRIFVAWRKAVRFLWKLPRNTHCVLLSLLSKDIPIETRLHLRFFKYVHNVIKSKNTVVRTCGKLLLQGSRSETGKSLNFLLQRYNINRKCIHGDVSEILQAIKPAQSIHDSVRSDAATIRELCDIRDQGLTSILEPDQVQLLLEELCTS